MKKFLKIILISLAVIFVIILIIPLFFKSDIMNMAKNKVNETVRARVDWADVSISLFRGFPDLLVSLEDVSVIGVEKFEGDTLMAFEDLSFDVDLISAFSGTIKVKSIILDEPVVRAIALKDSSVNWDITYPSDEQPEAEEDDTASMSLSISLKEFLIRNGSIHYYDEALDLIATIERFNLDMSGNFSAEYTNLDLNTSTEALSVEYEGVEYLDDVYLSISAILGADLVNSKYTIEENEINLNQIVMGTDGFISMPDDESIFVDINYLARETDFKSLLSLIPAIYSEDFEGLEATGNFSLEGNAKGTINDNVLPLINLNLDVRDGSFKYPDLPGSADDIQMDLYVHYDGVTGNNTRIDLDRFHMNLAGNPVNMNFHIMNPETDLQFNGSLDGRVDLSNLSDVIPMDDMQLSGIITSDIEVMGRYSDIENENYEAFNANGFINISDMKVSGGEVPVPVNISESRMNFTPRYVELVTFNATMGASDINMSGQLENFIPYILKDETIAGELSLNSNYLNFNELMGDISEEEEEVDEDTTELSVVEVPDNVDFRITANIDRLIYDKLSINNLDGRLIIKDGIVNMDRLSMNLLEGSLVMSGSYNTREISTPLVDLSLDMNNIDISSSFNAFNTVKQLAPVAEMTRGKVSVNFSFTSFLDSTMNPILNSVIGEGALQTDEIQIVNNNTLDKMTNLLNTDRFKDPSFKDLNLSFEMRDGRVFVPPFKTAIGSTNLEITGSQGIDQTMDYRVEVSIPREEFGSSVNDLLEDLTNKAQERGFNIQPGEKVNVAFQIAGNFSDPKIDMNLKESVKDLKEDVKEAVIDRVTDEVDKVKEDVREDISEEVDKIMSKAEEEAEKIRKTAGEAGERLIGEAELRRKQLINEAGSNPLKKLAAEKAGDELVRNAEKQAQNLMEEADKNAEKVMEEARKRAEEIKNR